MPTTGAKNGLTLADLSGKDYNDEQWELLLDQLTIDDMQTLVNTGGWKTAAIESVGKVATSDCDGPSGLSNYVTGSTGTQYPTEVLMAQTWSKEIATEIGSAMGQEFANANNYGWYGPAMNLHRSAFSGPQLRVLLRRCGAVRSVRLLRGQRCGAVGRVSLHQALRGERPRDEPHRVPDDVDDRADFPRKLPEAV